MGKFVLFEASPWRVSDGVSEAVRLAGGGSKPYTGLRGFTDWRAGLNDIPAFVAAAGYSQGGWNGGALPQTAAVSFFTADDALRALLLTRYVWVGAPVEIRTGDDVLAPGTYILELTGTIASVEVTDAVVKFTVADNSVKLSVPVTTATFAGTGGIEGPAEAEGRAKRRTWGFARNVEGFLLDKPNNIFEFGDPAKPYQGFSSVFDMGRAASPTPTVLAWQGSIAATFSALQASSPAAGSCVVAPSICCVKWWTVPAGPLTADIQGDNALGYATLIASIADLISGAAGVTMAAGTVSAINAVRGSTAGLHVSDNNETFAQALDRLLIPSNVLWGLNPDGTIRLGEIQIAKPTTVLTAVAVDRVETYKPIKQANLGYRRNHRIHSASEISAAILSSQIDDFSTSVPAYVAAGDSNRVMLSLFEKGTRGWAVNSAGSPTIILAETGAASGKKYHHFSASYTANSQILQTNSDVAPNVTSCPYSIRVTGGERLYVGAQIGVANPNPNCQILLRVFWWDATGGPCSPAATDVYSGLGSLSFPTLKQGFATAPSNAAFAAIGLISANQALGITGAVDLFLAEPMICGAGASQTVFPTFSPGPSSEPGADITANNGAIGDGNRVRFSLFENGVSGWYNYDNVAGATSFATGSSSGKKYIQVTDTFTANGQGISVGNDGAGVATSQFPFKVTPGERLVVTGVGGATFSSPAACSWLYRIYFYDSSMTNIGSADIASAAGNLSFPTLMANFVTVPASAAFSIVALYGLNNTGGAGVTATIYLAEPMVASAGAQQTAFPAFSPGPSSEAGASVDATISVNNPVQIFADTSGAPKSGELSKVVNAKLLRLGATITTATWTATLKSGNATFTTSVSGGVLALTLTGPNNATLTKESVIQLAGTDGNVVRTEDVKVLRVDDPPTNSGTSGSSGTTGTTTTLANTAGTSYSTGISATITAQAGASGRVDLTAPISFKRVSSAVGQTGVAGKWQWRVIGGTFADVSSETNYSAYAEKDTELMSYEGTVNVVDAKTGLTNGTAYEFRFLWRRIDVGGTASEAYRTSGTLQAAGS